MNVGQFQPEAPLEVRIKRAEIAFHSTQPRPGREASELHRAAHRALACLVIEALESKQCLDHPLVARAARPTAVSVLANTVPKSAMRAGM